MADEYSRQMYQCALLSKNTVAHFLPKKIMKLKMKDKSMLKEKRAKTLKGDFNFSDEKFEKSLSNFLLAIDSVRESLVGREDELDALTLALLTGQHLMLEGKHGTGKSMLAEELFKRITGTTTVFKKQFMKGTQLDEIFGPMKTEVYRRDAIWEHNISGMLPEAELAFLDEVYRASDMALPSMMRILNERSFFNGKTEVKCPLITAIGTTNFTTNNEELDAFHDRWLIKVKVESLSSLAQLREMMRKHLDRLTETDNKLNTVSLEEILYLQEAVRSIRLPDSILLIYNELISSYRKQMSSHFISDRRICQTLQLVQAKACLGGYENDEDSFDENFLIAAKFGLLTTHDEEPSNAFDSVYQKIVGSLARTREEMKDLKKIEIHVQKLRGLYDEKMSKKKATELHAMCTTSLHSLMSQTPDEKPVSKEGEELKEKLISDLEEIADTLQSSGLIQSALADDEEDM